ncbi:MAG: hypothetical protein AB1631_24095 [Acidobacteriota bacterium]
MKFRVVLAKALIASVSLNFPVRVASYSDEFQPFHGGNFEAVLLP